MLAPVGEAGVRRAHRRKRRHRAPPPAQPRGSPQRHCCPAAAPNLRRPPPHVALHRRFAAHGRVAATAVPAARQGPARAPGRGARQCLPSCARLAPPPFPRPPSCVTPLFLQWSEGARDPMLFSGAGGRRVRHHRSARFAGGVRRSARRRATLQAGEAARSMRRHSDQARGWRAGPGGAATAPPCRPPPRAVARERGMRALPSKAGVGDGGGAGMRGGGAGPNGPGGEYRGHGADSGRAANSGDASSACRQARHRPEARRAAAGRRRGRGRCTERCGRRAPALSGGGGRAPEGEGLWRGARTQESGHGMAQGEGSVMGAGRGQAQETLGAHEASCLEAGGRRRAGAAGAAHGAAYHAPPIGGATFSANSPMTLPGGRRWRGGGAEASWGCARVLQARVACTAAHAGTDNPPQASPGGA